MTFHYWFMLPVAIGIVTIALPADVVGATFSSLFFIQVLGDGIL